MRGGFDLWSGNKDPERRMVWPKTNKQNPETSSPGQEKTRWGGTEGKGREVEKEKWERDTAERTQFFILNSPIRKLTPVTF